MSLRYSADFRRSRLVFFSLFFRQTTELIAYVPLFTETDKITQAKSGQWKFSAKGPPFIFYLFYVTYKTGRDQRVPPFNFFRHCAKFFSKIFQGLKRVPPSSFLIFCNRMYVNESQRVPPFHFSALCDILGHLFTFGTQLSAFGKFVKVICLGLNCRGTQLTLFAFGTQFVLGLNLFWDSIVASPSCIYIYGKLF